MFIRIPYCFLAQVTAARKTIAHFLKEKKTLLGFLLPVGASSRPHEP